MGYQRNRKQKIDLVLNASVEGEGPLEAPVPMTVVSKCVYEVRPICEAGISTLLTTVFKKNRELCVKGKLKNANLVITIQQGEETPIETKIEATEPDEYEYFKVCLKLKQNDKISFSLQAGDNFVVVYDAIIKKRKYDCC